MLGLHTDIGYIKFESKLSIVERKDSKWMFATTLWIFGVGHFYILTVWSEVRQVKWKSFAPIILERPCENVFSQSFGLPFLFCQAIHNVFSVGWSKCPLQYICKAGMMRGKTKVHLLATLCCWSDYQGPKLLTLFCSQTRTDYPSIMCC